MTDNRTTERVDHPPRVREAIDELMREKDATDNRTTNYEKLFGTPERAARTLEEIECDNDICDFCPLFEACDNCLDVPLLEWLESEVLE